MSINITPIDVYAEVAQNLAVLFGTLKGSVLTNRDFGLSATFLDRPSPYVMAEYEAEIIEAAGKYEPRANITSISWSQQADSISGQVIPVVKFEVIDG